MDVPSLAILDGQLMDAGAAQIPVTDEGLLRGDGVFEVIRLYAGRPFALGRHLRRMARSAERLRLPIDIDAVADDAAALAHAAGPIEALLRLLVTRGGRRIALVEPLPHGDNDPLALRTIEYAPTRVLDQIKSLSYGANMLTTRLAREHGDDEALLVHPHGTVLEGPTSTFFASLDGETLLTPPLTDHVLDSISRQLLLELLPHAREQTIEVAQLPELREAFLLSTTREAAPIRTIDGAALPAAPGPLTTEARSAFLGYVAAREGQPLR